jgi:hypothetical protein
MALIGGLFRVTRQYPGVVLSVKILLGTPWLFVGGVRSAPAKLNVRADKVSTARGAHLDLLEFAAVRGVKHANGRWRGPEQPPIAPLAQRNDGRQEVFAHLGQDILMPPCFLGDRLALQDSASHQLLQPGRQQVARDIELLLKIVESRRAAKSLAQDHEAAPIADDVHGAGHGAFSRGPTFSLHGVISLIGRSSHRPAIRLISRDPARWFAASVAGAVY